MLTADFVRLYPQLFHMTDDGSWPSIERHGLLSTRGLLDKWQVASDLRDELSDVRRFSTTIEHPEHGSAVIRDQKPINRDRLAALLDDMTVSEWLEELNSRVFFFAQRERMLGLLSATSYRGRAHTILTIDTERLVQSYESRIQLCRINSGFAAPHATGRRGRDTFQPIADYVHPDRAIVRVPGDKRKWDVAEVCVIGDIPDIRDYVSRVERMRDGVVLERIF